MALYANDLIFRIAIIEAVKRRSLLVATTGAFALLSGCSLVSESETARMVEVEIVNESDDAIESFVSIETEGGLSEWKRVSVEPMSSNETVVAADDERNGQVSAVHGFVDGYPVRTDLGVEHDEGCPKVVVLVGHSEEPGMYLSARAGCVS